MNINLKKQESQRVSDMKPGTVFRGNTHGDYYLRIANSETVKINNGFGMAPVLNLSISPFRTNGYEGSAICKVIGILEVEL